MLTLFRMGLSGTGHGWRVVGGGGGQIRQSYTLPKDKNIYKSRETPLKLCLH